MAAAEHLCTTWSQAWPQEVEPDRRPAPIWVGVADEFWQQNQDLMRYGDMRKPLDDVESSGAHLLGRRPFAFTIVLEARLEVAPAPTIN